MIRGRAEKRTDPAVKLSDYIQRVQAEEGVEPSYSGERQPLSGCCQKTVIERCAGCPYATLNS